MRNHTTVSSTHSPLVSDLLHVRNSYRGSEICDYFAVRAWEGLSRALSEDQPKGQHFLLTPQCRAALAGRLMERTRSATTSVIAGTLGTVGKVQ
jgi:hypothetical protein